MWLANYISQFDNANQCHASKVLMDDDCTQGKDDYSDIQKLHISSTLMCKQTMCTLRCTDHWTQRCCQNECIVNVLKWILACFGEDLVRISGVYVHMGIRQSKHRHDCLFSHSKWIRIVTICSPLAFPCGLVWYGRFTCAKDYRILKTYHSYSFEWGKLQRLIWPLCRMKPRLLSQPQIGKVSTSL